MFDDAKERLVQELWEYYRDGRIAEDRKEFTKAREFYRKIQRRFLIEPMSIVFGKTCLK